MVAARAWRRQLYGGVGATVLVPGTLLAALIALAFAGGFARLGTLGQLFAGPSVPTPAPTWRGAPAVHPLAGANQAALSGAVAGAPAARTGFGPAGTRPGSASAPRAGAPAPRGARHGGGSLAPSPGGSRPGSSAPAGGSAPSSPPPPRPTLADRIVGTATQVTSAVPSPAGPVATAVLQAAGTVVDAVAPVPAPHAATAALSGALP